MLRLLALGIEDHTDARHVLDRFADRVVMHVEVDLRSLLDQAARALGEDVSILAERVLAEEASRASHAVVLARRVQAGPRLDDVERRMMDDGEALRIRFGLDFLDPA